MRAAFVFTAMAILYPPQTFADTPPQLQQVTFQDCSGGGFGMVVGGGHLTCRRVSFFRDGKLETLIFPREKRAMLTSGEFGTFSFSNSDSQRTDISCTIPNFDPQKGFSAWLGGIGLGMGGGRGGDIAKIWGRNGASCVPSLAGGFLGAKITLNIGYFRVPAQR